MIIGLVAVMVVLGLAFVMLTLGRSAAPPASEGAERVNVLADSDNACVECHTRTTPGIVDQYGHSTMAAAEVSCQDCHEVEADYPGSVEHEGTHVLNQPTTAMCEKCHVAEVAQFNQSRHALPALPAYVAYEGAQNLLPEHLAMYEAITEGTFQPDKMRNTLLSWKGRT